MKLQSYNFIKQQKKIMTKKVTTVLIVCLGINVLGAIGFFVWKNNNNVCMLLGSIKCIMTFHMSPTLAVSTSIRPLIFHV